MPLFVEVFADGLGVGRQWRPVLVESLEQGRPFEHNFPFTNCQQLAMVPGLVCGQAARRGGDKSGGAAFGLLPRFPRRRLERLRGGLSLRVSERRRSWPPEQRRRLPPRPCTVTPEVGHGAQAVQSGSGRGLNGGFAPWAPGSARCQGRRVGRKGKIFWAEYPCRYGQSVVNSGFFPPPPP